MHPSQVTSRKQVNVFDSLSGCQEGLTYSNNSMLYLCRVGSQLQIVCFVDGRWSHIVEAGYVQAPVLRMWENIKSLLHS